MQDFRSSSGCPCRSYGLIFVFSISKAIRMVLSLGILDQRSYKGLILDATKFFRILDKFSFKETFSNQQTNIFGFESAFQLLNKTFV